MRFIPAVAVLQCLDTNALCILRSVFLDNGKAVRIGLWVFLLNMNPSFFTLLKKITSKSFHVVFGLIFLFHL